jgi:hypothetical protein
MSVLKVNTINDASGGSNAVLYGVAAPANSMGFRNRIINGNMVIDQRNAGASVTPASSAYTLDRWQVTASQASKFSVQQSSVAPAGFTNSALITSLSAYTVGAAEEFLFRQNIEGLNMGDFGWGVAGAATVTLSFWVRSSLTGTFGGAIQNSAQNRCYPFSYTISAANTWEQKSVTIAGDTSGTWLTTNGVGLRANFSLGSGATNSGTAGAWAGTYYASATGATSVVGTSGATFYITGVQLEAGSVASPFERRDYGRELMMCQRYFQLCSPSMDTMQVATGTVNYSTQYPFVCEMRAVPTLVNTTLGSSNLNTVNADNFPGSQARSFRYRLNTSTTAGLAVNAQSLVTASAEL